MEELYLKIASEIGTPVYVYDSDRIQSQYDKLINAFSSEIQVKVKYAMKALSNMAILKLLREKGAGCDCVSIEEVQIALKSGFEAKDILFTPNCVDFEEIEAAVIIGVAINIDNLYLLEEFGEKYGSSIPCCIRMNPHILAGGNAHISVGHIDSKFGISIHQVKHIQRICEHYKINVNGLHMHSGSDILDSETFIRGAELIYEVAHYFPNLTFLDLGSGFKVAYKEHDVVTDIQQLGKKLSKSFLKFCKEYGRNLELWFEPGKFLVSEAGKFLVKVNTIKQTTSTVFAGVNSGQNHLIRPMFYDAYHHITNLSNAKGKKKLYSVVGYICESDTFGYDRSIHEIRVGDVLCIHNAGAYGYSMSNNYNSRLRPAEVLIENGTFRIIRKKETLEDLLKLQIF